MAVAAVYALVLAPVLDGTAVLYLQDLAYFVLPHKAEAGRALAQGQWPWVSWALGGLPLWAHPSAEVAWPTTVFFAWTDPFVAHAVSTVVHAGTTALGMFMVARLLGLDGWRAGAAAVAFAACGPVAGTWSIKALPVVGLPWLVASALWAAHGVPRAAWGAGLVGVGALALHPDPPPVLAALVCAAVLAWRPRAGRRALRTLLPGWAAVALGCAAVVLPAWTTVGASARAAAPGVLAGGLPPWRALELLAPGLLGVPGAVGELQGLMADARMNATYTGTLYVGAVAGVAAVLAGRRVRGKTQRRLLGLTLGMAVLTLGDNVPGMQVLFGALGARGADKLSVVWAFVFLLWCVRRLPAPDANGTWPRVSAWKVGALVLVAAGALLAPHALARVALVPFAQASPRALELAAGQLGVTAALWLLAACWRVGGGRLPGRWRGAALLSVVLLDAFWTVRVVLPNGPRAWVERDQLPGAADIPEGTGVACCTERGPMVAGPLRVAPDGPGWQAALEHVRRGFLLSAVLGGRRVPLPVDTGGFEPADVRAVASVVVPALSPQQQAAAWRAWGVQAAVLVTPWRIPGEAVLQDHEGPVPLGVHLLLEKTGAPLRPAPRVFASLHWKGALRLEEAVSGLAGPEGAPVVGPMGLPPPDPAPANGEEPPPSVNVRAVADDLVEAQVRCARACVVVLRMVPAPGWRVEVDGTPQDIWPANGIHQGVWVPAGEHRVVFSYLPPLFRMGAIASLMGVLLMAVLMVRALPGVGRRGSKRP